MPKKALSGLVDRVKIHFILALMTQLRTISKQPFIGKNFNFIWR